MAWSTRYARSCPTLFLTHSHRKSSPSRHAAWSVGLRRGCPRVSAARPGGSMASARTSTFRRPADWSTVLWRRHPESTPSRTGGFPNEWCGRSSRSSMRACPSPGSAAWAGHLGGTGEDADSTRRARRFSSVRHLADLFDRYALQRPEMVRAWAEGQDTDGAGQDLPDDAVWQAKLWRRLNQRIPQPGPAERLEGACARLREEPDLLDLAQRLSLFGLTRLPAGPPSGASRALGRPRRPPVPTSPVPAAVAKRRR